MKAARRRQVIAGAVVGALAILVAIVWLQAVRSLTASPHSPAPPARHAFAVVWGGTVYTTESSLRAALGRKGIDWQTWVQRHRAVLPHASPPPGSTPLRLSSSSSRSLTFLLVIFAALLGVAALTPRPLAARLSERALWVDYRTPLLAAAGSITVAIALASLV